MSTDSSPNSDALHKLEVENHIAKMSEDYKIVPQVDDFSKDFNDRMEMRRAG